MNKQVNKLIFAFNYPPWYIGKLSMFNICSSDNSRFAIFTSATNVALYFGT
jgi:hypothetical protein